MEERRKSIRHEIEVEIKLKRLSGGALEENAVPLLVDIKDISKTGMKFFSKEDLEVGSFYDTKITLWTKETIQSLFEIVRKEETDEGYIYGCMFVGMPESEKFRIEVYELFKEMKER